MAQKWRQPDRVVYLILPLDSRRCRLTQTFYGSLGRRGTTLGRTKATNFHFFGKVVEIIDGPTSIQNEVKSYARLNDNLPGTVNLKFHGFYTVWSLLLFIVEGKQYPKRKVPCRWRNLFLASTKLAWTSLVPCEEWEIFIVNLGICAKSVKTEMKKPPRYGCFLNWNLDK